MSKFGTFQNETREGGEGGMGIGNQVSIIALNIKRPVTYRHQNETKKWFFFFFLILNFLKKEIYG